MLSEVIEHYGIIKDFRNAGYFETDQYKLVFNELKHAIRWGNIVALTGIVGCGKTKMLKRIQEVLLKEREILVSKSLCVDKDRVNLGMLIMALFYDLAEEKDCKIPTGPEKRERKLRELIHDRKKPVALFIDEAHDLHGKTLIGLKRLIEVVQDGGGILSVVLAGHPSLKNDLRKPTMEEIGSRATVLELEGIEYCRRQYIEWLLAACIKNKDETTQVFSPEAVGLLAERLKTPLQIEHYLTLALEEGYKIGQKPITPELIESVLAKDLDALESKLTRQGYNVKVLSNMLNVRPAEIRSFLQGQLSPNRSQELKEELLAAGIPL